MTLAISFSSWSPPPPAAPTLQALATSFVRVVGTKEKVRGSKSSDVSMGRALYGFPTDGETEAQSKACLKPQRE